MGCSLPVFTTSTWQALTRRCAPQSGLSTAWSPSIRKFNRSSHVLCAIALLALCLLFPGLSTAQAPADAGAVDIIAKLLENHSRFAKIRNLDIEYQLTNEYLKKKPKLFAFDTCVFRYVKGGDRCRIDFRGTQANATNPTKALIRRASWDGTVGMKIIGDEKFVYIVRGIPELIFYNNVYIDYLGYPEATGSVSRALGSLAKIEPDYWIPETLTKNRSQFIVSKSDGAGGQYKVAWEGRDELWVDADHGCRITRRDLYYPSGRLLRERTSYDDFQDVDGLSLPSRIVREFFGTPQDPKELWNEVVEINTVQVNRLNTDALPAEAFRLPIREGDFVTDMVRRIKYRKVGTDVDKLSKGIGLIEQRIPNRSRLYWALGIIIPIIVFVVIVLIRVANVRRERRSSFT